MTEDVCPYENCKFLLCSIKSCRGDLPQGHFLWAHESPAITKTIRRKINLDFQTFPRSRHPEGAVHGDSKDLNEGECYLLQNKILRLRLRSAQNDDSKEFVQTKICSTISCGYGGSKPPPYGYQNFSLCSYKPRRDRRPRRSAPKENVTF